MADGSDKTLPQKVALSTGVSYTAASALTLPQKTAASVGLSNTNGLSDQFILPKTADSIAITSTIGTSDEPVIKKQATGTASTGNIITSILSLPEIVGSGTAITSQAASSSVTLRLIVATGAAYQVELGQVVTPENPNNDPQDAWALNYETNAPSRYYRFPANSMCRFKGKVFVANAGGIYEVAGDTDAGQKIDSQITLPTSDFGSSKNKRVPYIYLGVASTGRLQLKVVANRSIDRYYAVNIADTITHGSRVDIGKGLEARYWTLALASMDGATIDLSNIEFSPLVLARHGV
jgi:hypothetical protein